MHDKQLLKIARNAMERRIDKTLDIPKGFSKKQGVFVTLTIKGELRGCIGYIEPIMPLYKAVEECAFSAAYNDPRFPPVTSGEFKHVRIEISILTVPKKLPYKDTKDLLKKLSHKFGVIIRKGPHSATYLPQVWEQIPEKEEFLSSLCMKAGLPEDAWKAGDLEVSTYEVEKMHE